VRKPVENALILKELQRQTRKCQSACGSKKRPASFAIIDFSTNIKKFRIYIN